MALELCAGLALLCLGALPAHADVKDGVDAWARGDYDAAVAQWQSPAAKGDPDAMFNMGQAYKLGRGVAKDMVKAEDFYARAARKGHIRAADNYGILLFQTNRQTEALPWLNAAVDRGEPRAMYILGIAAYNGDYAQKDPVRAYALMTRAAQAGLQQAINSLAAMNEAIPLEQRQQGVALAEELDRKAVAARASEMGSAELGGGKPARRSAPGASRQQCRARVDPGGRHSPGRRQAMGPGQSPGRSPDCAAAPGGNTACGHAGQHGHRRIVARAAWCVRAKGQRRRAVGQSAQSDRNCRASAHGCGQRRRSPAGRRLFRSRGQPRLRGVEGCGSDLSCHQSLTSGAGLQPSTSCAGSRCWVS